MGAKSAWPQGSQWVELRECRDCGHVGCCDSSPGRHATAHFNETNHPVMRSIEPGAGWTWCYVHELQGELEQPAMGGPTTR